MLEVPAMYAAGRNANAAPASHASRTPARAKSRAVSHAQAAAATAESAFGAHGPTWARGVHSHSMSGYPGSREAGERAASAISLTAHANFHVSVSVPKPDHTNGNRVRNTHTASSAPTPSVTSLEPSALRGEFMCGPLLLGFAGCLGRGPRRRYRPFRAPACAETGPAEPAPGPHRLGPAGPPRAATPPGG